LRFLPGDLQMSYKQFGCKQNSKCLMKAGE
jgi:hypothetical protein